MKKCLFLSFFSLLLAFKGFSEPVTVDPKDDNKDPVKKVIAQIIDEKTATIIDEETTPTDDEEIAPVTKKDVSLINGDDDSNKKNDPILRGYAANEEDPSDEVVKG